ncbi:MAG TPA: aminoglycoside phosphotransferase family protein [Pseudonocardiaceae bacterium]|nr:aminoglycoside phosphotransferase family protein [Pseudonocardiaceae bacterium]
MSQAITDTLRGIGGSRVRWADVPGEFRAEIGRALGAEVVAAADQTGGFSPGVAARLVLADGRRAFVKAAAAARNPDSVALLRREASVLRALPSSVPGPRVLGTVVGPEWMALLQREIPGRPPALPWPRAELDRVLSALADLATALTPAPLSLPSLAETHATAFTGWRTVAAGEQSGDGLPEWARARVDSLAELESRWEMAAEGDTLLHADLRADNLLLTEDAVVPVDWAHACTGVAWIELLGMLPSVVMQGGPDPGEIWAAHPVARGVDPARVTAVLAAFAGFFLVDSLRPAPPNLPRLRAFQRAQGEAALAWLRSRL